MRLTKFSSVAALVAVAAVAISCAEVVPTSPSATVATATPETELLELEGLLKKTGLLRCDPLPTATASAVIGREGGTINVGPHRLTIPRNALSTPTLITATAPSGQVNRVEFQPHGLMFAKDATLSMSYANCNLVGSLAPKRIAYITDDLSVLYYLLSVDDVLNRRVSARLEHFSEYAVSW